jgi:hypothetical protein
VTTACYSSSELYYYSTFTVTLLISDIPLFLSFNFSFIVTTTVCIFFLD